MEYDLMTRTGRTLSEYMNMGASGKLALLSFIEHLPPDSALFKEMNPKEEVSDWLSPLMTNVILADLFDMYSSVHTKKGKKPVEYPRPKKKKTLGKDPIPVSKFWDWWNNEDEVR